jgi:hypothetical protein
LVVAGGVEGEVADEFAVFGEDADVEVVGQDQHALAGVSSAEADVVESAVVAQRDGAAVADAVLADPVVAVGDGDAGGGCFGAGLERVERGATAQGPLRSGGVVVVAEAVELGLEGSQGLGWGLFGEPAFLGLVETFDAPMFVKGQLGARGWVGMCGWWRGGC